MATPKKQVKKPTIWNATSGALLREYRTSTGDEMVDELRRRLPAEFSVDKLFELDSKAIVRRELFRKGAQFILDQLEQMSLETPIHDDASAGGYENV